MTTHNDSNTACQMKQCIPDEYAIDMKHLVKMTKQVNTDNIRYCLYNYEFEAWFLRMCAICLIMYSVIDVPPRGLA